MRAIRYCLSVVRRGGAAPNHQAVAPDVDEISAFLVTHVQSLNFGAATNNAPHTTFRDSASQDRFEVLRCGTDAQFLQVADALAGDLLNEMSHVNSKDGVLVCVTLEDDSGDPVAAALKLQVVQDHGAVLELLESGEAHLAAVERVLDRPGDLQKGLVFPDARPESAAVVGDKANAREARYFLLAMGLEAEEKAKAALGIVANAVVDSVQPSERSRVLAQLKAAEPGELQGVVDAAVADATLTRPTEEIVRVLRNAERPVRNVNTRAPLKTRIRAGTDVIDIGTLDAGRVNIVVAPEGGWDVTIHLDVEPHVEHRS